jgi:hypothetical protein
MFRIGNAGFICPGESHGAVETNVCTKTLVRHSPTQTSITKQGAVEISMDRKSGRRGKCPAGIYFRKTAVSRERNPAPEIEGGL